MNAVVDTSLATIEFKTAINGYLAGESSDRVRVESYLPRVKVQRVLNQLLNVEPTLAIERVVIRGSSGCSDIVGTVDVHTSSGSHVIDFVWCCRWRAECEGYVDYFGFPDQARAAREFDWQCFQRWEHRGSTS